MPTLPRDFTEVERRETVEWLCTLPLDTLRKRQSFIAEQQETLHARWERRPSALIEQGQADLAVMEELTRQAVECVAFGPAPNPGPEAAADFSALAGNSDAQIRVTDFGGEWNAAVWTFTKRGAGGHWVESASAWATDPHAAITAAITAWSNG